MSAGIVVNDFKYVPGTNDAEYIKLLEKQLKRYKAINNKAIQKIKYISSAYALVKHGHWINSGYACGETDWECSVCHCHEWRTGKTEYCMRCGAKMDEVTE